MTENDKSTDTRKKEEENISGVCGNCGCIDRNSIRIGSNNPAKGIVYLLF